MSSFVTLFESDYRRHSRKRIDYDELQSVGEESSYDEYHEEMHVDSRSRIEERGDVNRDYREWYGINHLFAYSDYPHGDYDEQRQQGKSKRQTFGFGQHRAAEHF